MVTSLSSQCPHNVLILKDYDAWVNLHEKYVYVRV